MMWVQMEGIETRLRLVIFAQAPFERKGSNPE
jgi:hypothetical protein